MLREILLKQPDNAQALFALSQIALKYSAFEDALPILKQCVQLLPQHPEPLLQLAEVLAEINQLQQARACYQQLVIQFPEFSKGYFKFAGLLLNLGERTSAEEYLRKTLQLEPTHTRAFLALSDLNEIATDNPLMEQMQSLLAQLENQINTEKMAIMYLHYALGKAYDDQSNYQQAFFHWKAANKLQLKNCNFRVNQMLPFFSVLKTTFNKKLLTTEVKHLDSSLTPIFIVGMPRSGSTLLEQMLSSHTEIETAGEVNYISSNIVQKIESITGKAYPQDLNKLSPSQLNMLGNDYLNELQKHHPKSRFIIDKLPANYQSIGLIKLILPKAIIINLKRNPLAISFSIFRNCFAENEPYFCDLDEFSDFYLAYSDLMKHWDHLLDQEFIILSYEQLIDEPKKLIQQILSYCALTWQDSCLQFYKQQKQILTLSANQVNKPLYTNSLEYWKNYSKFLEKTADKLSLNDN